jgi:hypothetical protein
MDTNEMADAYGYRHHENECIAGKVFGAQANPPGIK